MNSETLDRTFAALADATRRAILVQLSQGAQTVSQLCAPHKMTQPAISKHLRVMEAANLITRERRGRQHFVSARPAVAQQAAAWINHYSRFWGHHFDAVERHLNAIQESQNDN